MKKLFAVLISVQLAGCGTVEFLTKDPRHTTYDVCHKQPHQCKVMPNWTNEALIRQARGETW